MCMWARVSTEELYGQRAHARKQHSKDIKKEWDRNSKRRV